MQFERKLTWFAVAALLLSALPGSAHAARATQQGANLLANPGFEGEYVVHADALQIAPGWTAWWIPRREDQPDYVNQVPKYEPTSHPERVHGGAKAQLLATFYATHIAGVYQQVKVTPGADLRFSAFGKGWTSTSDDPLNVSVGGTDLRMRVGIDPYGGTDPLSPNVRWSEQVNAADSWVRFDAFARAQSGTATVFVYSAPFDARRHNDVFWDDAELVALSGDSAATAQAHYPTATPTPVIHTPTPVTLPLGQNLLKNPGFEGKWFNPCSWKGDLPWNHIPCEPWYKELMVRWNTVYTPEGWTGWWQQPITDTAHADFYKYPNRCPKGAPETCVVWHNPEYGGTDWIRVGPPRIHSGKNSLKYFTFWSVHEAGVFQTVEGIKPGTLLRFGAWMHAWSADEGPNREQPSPYESGGQTSMHMKIGVDPTGGRNPWSSDVVWSPEVDTYDQFGYYQVTAAASSDKVTVFTYSRPEKMLKHNDVYLDDLELVAVSIPGGSAAPVAAPTQPPAAVNVAPPSSAPRPAPAPRGDGATVHVVQPGDTVWGLSVQYDVSMDQILRLNGMNQDTPLLIGQEVIIELSGAASQSPPAPTETPAAETAPIPAATEIAAPGLALSEAEGTGELCVSAFTDSNGDNVMDPGENLVGGVVFVLQDARAERGVAATRTTDGLSEPYCFVQAAGAYSLLIQVPAGRIATSDTRWGLVLAPGTPININFGSRPADDVGAVTARSAPEAGLSKALSGLAGIVLVVVAVAGLFWLLRVRFARGGRL